MMKMITPKNLTFLITLFFFFILLSSFKTSASSSHPKFPISKIILDEDNLGHWKDAILNSSAEAPGPGSDASGPLILAVERTNRPDILRHFRRYRNGWNITDKDYWASVGFTGVAGFVLAVLWFVSFGVALIVHHCCGWRIGFKGKESQRSQMIYLVLFIVFTCAAAVGCILLSVGQDRFHGEAVDTLNYVVNQSDYTVQTLMNVTTYLSLAKTVNVAQVFLPPDVQDDIDKLNVDLNTAADTLRVKTSENSRKSRRVFDTVRSSVITVAIVMLLVSLLGLFLSIFGYEDAIQIFIISGWLLVAVTFILWGVFVILNNAISDTCMAMEQWVDNPHAETALSNILPCVDEETTNRTLVKSKQVIIDLANMVNGFLGSFGNSYSPQANTANSNYYNQSGPLVPYLCYPYDSQMQDRECSPQEVSMANASLVWENYTCTISESGLCNSAGRLTPDMYEQLVGAVNISYGLEHYAPPVLSFQDCNFVRDTFRNITSDYCPPLEHHLGTVNAGLVLVSVGVMLSLALWIMYANRPQREEVFAKLLSRIIGSCKRKNRCGDKNDALMSKHKDAVAEV